MFYPLLYNQCTIDDSLFKPIYTLPRSFKKMLFLRKRLPDCRQPDV
ncbi:hypothetical protein CHCC20375_2831 [Bacillus licheniformis]|nr:hypothetical protein CHCC20375_2831 [Bacillus licheniformis]